MAGILRRLIKGAAKKSTKVVKPKPKVKPTTAANRAAVRARAAKASKTKVQTAPVSRKLGTKATLNGKPVYWGGKDWGWQSKASLTKITNGSKSKPRATGTKSSTYPVSKTDRSPLVGRSRSKAVSRSKREQGYDSREERLATNRALSRTSKKETDRKGVTSRRAQPTSGQYLPKGRVKDVTEPLKRKPKATTTKGVGTTKKTPVTSSQRLTAKQRQRRLTTKNRDIGAKAAAARIDATKGGASVARGDIKSTSRGAVETSTLKGTASRARNQRLIEQRRAKQLGKDADKGRQVRLSAADARAAADQYEIDKGKEIQRISRTMTGRAASDYRKKATKEMKREAAVIRKNARTKSLTTRTASKNNPSPSHSSQNPRDLKGNASSRRSLRDAQKEGQRFSADMERRKAEGKLRPTRSMGAENGKPASTNKGLKKGKPSASGKPQANRESRPRKYARRSTLTPAQRLAREKAMDKKIGKPKMTPKKKGPQGTASDRSVITNRNDPQTVKERQANAALRRRNRRSSTSTSTNRTQRQAIQRAEGSNRVRGRDANDRARLRSNTDASSTKSDRSNGATTKAQQTMKSIRERTTKRDAGRAAIERESQAAFKRGASGAGSAGW